jgi:hypothetical protein
VLATAHLADQFAEAGAPRAEGFEAAITTALEGFMGVALSGRLVQ